MAAYILPGQAELGQILAQPVSVVAAALARPGYVEKHAPGRGQGGRLGADFVVKLALTSVVQ